MTARITKHLVDVDQYEDLLEPWKTHSTAGVQIVSWQWADGQSTSFPLLFPFLTIFISRIWDFFSLSDFFSLGENLIVIHSLVQTYTAHALLLDLKFAFNSKLKIRVHCVVFAGF